MDATKEFCTEFVQTDFNIMQSLTNIFDQIENIDRIVRDHRKSLRSKVRLHNGMTKGFLKDEAVVLKLHGEMIQRAFDMLAEKNELIQRLEEDVTELLEMEGTQAGTDDPIDENPIEEIVVEEQLKTEVQLNEEEAEPAYELYYIEDEQQDCEDGDNISSTVADKAENNKSPNVEPTKTSPKRGRPRKRASRTLDDCLEDLPKNMAEYIRSATVNADAKFQCDVCEITSKTKMLLYIHYMKVHLKVKNKICPHCDKAFASQGT